VGWVWETGVAGGGVLRGLEVGKKCQKLSFFKYQCGGILSKT